MIEDAVLAALNHLLNQAEWARQRLAPFAGRHARVSLPPWPICLQVIEDGWFGVAAGDAACDVEVMLPANAPLLALQGIDKVFEMARIEGNAQFATELAFVLKNLRWDYEEDMARLVGDIAAHRMAGGLAAVVDFGARLSSSVTASNPLLAVRSDQAVLAAGIANAGTAVERAERRIEALTHLAAIRKA